MVRDDTKYSGGTVASDDDIRTVPSRYTFDNTATSTISSVDLQDYGTYSKLGGGMKRQPAASVPSSTSTAASLVTVDEGTSTEVEFRDSPSKDGKHRQQETGSVGTGKSHIFPKFGMFRTSPQKNKPEDSQEQSVAAHSISSTPSWVQAASLILPHTGSQDDAPSQNRQPSGSPVKPDSPNREVRRYKNDGSRLEQLLNNVEDEKDELEASMTSVSLGDQLSSTGMYSALYSDYASSKDDYSLNATEEGMLNASDSQFSRAAYSHAASTRTASSLEANSLQAEVDAESKQASLDYHAMTSALNQTTNAGSPTPIAPSHFFQPVVRNVCEEDDDSNDVRTVSRSVEANSSYGDVPSLDAEYGSGLTDPTPALPAPMPSMAQRLFGGGLPAPVVKSMPQLKASPTNSTGATTSDDDDNEHRALSNASTPLRSGTTSFRNIQDILRDPNSAPHDLSDGENSEKKPAKYLSLDGTSFELVIPNNDYQKDDDPQTSSIASITNAMERGRTMATQAPRQSNGAVNESNDKESEESKRSRDTSSFFMAWVCLFLLLILGALIAGVCGSGYCSSKQWQSSSSVNEASPADDDLLANLPPDFFEDSGTITFQPTASPVTAPATQQIPSTTQVTSPTNLVPVPADAFVPPPTVPIVLVPIFVGGFAAAGETESVRPPAAVVLTNPTELFEAVDNYVAGITEAPIGSWDVSRITDFSQTFSAFRNDAMSTFNEHLTGWDTRNAISMRQMFHGAMDFNGDVSSFDTGNVQSMRDVFANAESFNGDVGAWNTARVTDMQGLFRGAVSFNGDISSWNTDAVTDMAEMFLNAASFNGRVGSWSTRNVVNMAGMFRGTAAFNQDLPWDTKRVEDMDAMFMESSSFDGSVSFNTENIESMNRVFYYAGSFTGRGVADWNTRKVTSMDRMLTGAGSFIGDITSWDMGRVRNTEKMLAGASLFSQNLCLWQPALLSEPLLTSSANMFAHTKCSRQEDPTVSNSFSTLCAACEGAPFPQIDDDVMEFVADLGQVFSGANELKAAVDAYLEDSSPDAGVAQLYGHPIGEWKVGRVTDFSNLFSTNRNPAAIRFNENLGDWDMSSAKTTTAMFEGAVSFSGVGLSTWDTSQVSDMSRMFAYSGFEEDISGWNVANVHDFGRMFMFAQSFQSDLSGWNVRSAEQMGWMFRGALQFSSDLSRWNIRNVQGFDKAFAGATRFFSNLCSWKDQVNPESSTVGMFSGSACASTADPSVASTWCSVCP